MPSDNWTTPRPFFDRLNQIWRFDWDIAASHENHLLPNYWTVDDDALSQRWIGIRGFLNPPYSQLNTHPWAEMAYYAARTLGSTIVMLIPNNRGETGMWHDWCMKATRFVWIKGRLKFGDPERATQEQWIENFMGGCGYRDGRYCKQRPTLVDQMCMYEKCPLVKPRSNPRDGSVLVVFEANKVGLHGVRPANDSMLAYP